MSSGPPSTPKPPNYPVILWRMLKGMLAGWLAFNILLLCVGILLVRIYSIDPWPYRAAIAEWLTYQRFINPAELVPEGMAYDTVELLDTDDDGELERLLYYRYDLIHSRSPYGATLLDLNQCRPRGIDSYVLIPVDRDYLSESYHQTQIRDIPGVGGGRELLIWGLAGGIRTELSVFQWVDTSEPCSQPAFGERGYVNLGTFRGSGGIAIDGNRIRVKDRAFERSQLAVTRVYDPSSGMYRQGVDGAMLDPNSKAVEFTFSPPTPVPATYYPEKAVLAFYLSIGTATDDAKALLDESAIQTYIEGSYGKGVAGPDQLTSLAEVKEIAYFPDPARERAHENIGVEVELVNRLPDGSLTGPYRYRVWVRGVPRPGAFPYDCEWRIFQFDYLP